LCRFVLHTPSCICGSVIRSPLARFSDAHIGRRFVKCQHRRKQSVFDPIMQQNCYCEPSKRMRC
jgi:hypothetical protein